MKEKLSTIQKREKLNNVFVLDKKGNGGANHRYSICQNSQSAIAEKYAELQFQDGARRTTEKTDGVCDQDLLEIVRHRLQGFVDGGLSTRETAIALTHVEEALLWLNKRTEDRIERNVLGTNNK